MGQEQVERMWRATLAAEMGAPAGFALTGREMVSVWGRLTDAERTRLGEFGERLREGLVEGRFAGSKYGFLGAGIERLRAGVAGEELVMMACLYPALTSEVWRRKRLTSPVEALSHTARSFNEERQQQAVDWLAWAVSVLEAARFMWWNGVSAIGPEAGDQASGLGAALGALEEARDWRQRVQWLRALTVEEGRALVERCVRLLELRQELGVAVGKTLLCDLAGVLPAALTGFQGRLAEYGELWRVGGGIVFRGADGEASRKLAARAEAGVPDMDGLLKAMVWIGDEVVRERLQVWRREGKRFAGLHVLPEMYCYEAGWELMGDGERRQLYFDEAYTLARAGEATEARGSAVRVAERRGDRCGRCGHPLTTILAMDLGDSRLKFLGLSGGRLAIPVCSTCWDCTYARLDREGRAEWLAESTGVDAPGDFYAWPTGHFMLGEAARSPVEAVALVGSWIGGVPHWIDDAKYPLCCGCGRTMMLLAHIDLCELGGDGMVYVYLCRECLISGTRFKGT